MAYTALVSAVAFAFLVGSVEAQTMLDAERSRIEKEVRQTVQSYVEAVKANDLPTMRAFWGDFDDFVHAGDGRVFGDHDKWTAWLADNLPVAVLEEQRHSRCGSGTKRRFLHHELRVRPH